MQDSQGQIKITQLLPDVNGLVSVLNSTLSAPAMNHLLQAQIAPDQVCFRSHFVRPFVDDVKISLPTVLCSESSDNSKWSLQF